MFIKETIHLSITNLKAQKKRAFLTMLGIIIGISSIITITSVIGGAESLITNQIQSIGSNIIGVLPGKSEENGPPAAVMGIVITTLKNEDTEAIKAKVPHVVAATSYVSATEPIFWSNQNHIASIYGVSADYPILAEAELEAGYFFSDESVRGMENVAVIGSEIKDELFNGNDPIGEKIKIKQNSFLIVGVMKPQGSSGFQNVDNMVFIPVTTAQKKILGINHIGFLRVKIDQEKNLTYAIEDIENLLRERHNIKDPAKDDFTARSTNDAQAALSTVTSALRFFLVAIVFISLLVGGIGIMNIMLAAVNQRIREIGLRKSVGASRKEIMVQFLTETLIISLCGAIIGIIIGLALSYLISIVVNALDYDWDFIISWSAMIFSCLVSGLIGLIFGIFPAKKAASLDPITALRYE